MVLLLVFGTVNLASTKHVLDYFSQRHVSFQILLRIAGVISAVTDAETSQRGFLITGVDGYLDTYRGGNSSAMGRLDELKMLSTGDQRRLQHIGRARGIGEEQIRRDGAVIALRRSDGFEAAAKKVRGGHGQQDMDRIRQIVGEFSDEENQRLKILMDMSITEMKQLYLIVVLGTLGALLALLLGSWLLARTFRGRSPTMTAASGAHRFWRIGWRIWRLASQR